MELLKEILNPENLNKAYKRVYQNKGASGVDGVTVEEIADYIKGNKEVILNQIRKRKYRPQPVRRVQIHGTIISSIKTKNKKHETFHLRDVFISPTSDVEIVLTPIDTIYRIYPIHLQNNIYICDASKKAIDEVINNIKMIDK